MKTIREDQARAAMDAGEFGDDILGCAPRVAVVLTQSWCPEWRQMKTFLSGYGEAEVFVLEYDRAPLFRPFRDFKENRLGNDRIPYVRYYRGGQLVGESNAVSQEEFTRQFGK